MKKYLSKVLLLASIGLLSGCNPIGSIGGLGGNNGGGNNGGGNGSSTALKETSIETLKQKYNGFEITYRFANRDICVGAKDNMYWSLVTDFDGNLSSDGTCVTIVENGQKVNNCYDENDQSYIQIPAEDNQAATSADSFLNWLITDVDESYTKSVNVNYNETYGEPATRYLSGDGFVAITVSNTDGYVLSYKNTLPEGEKASFAVRSIVKGNDIELPVIE